MKIIFKVLFVFLISTLVARANDLSCGFDDRTKVEGIQSALENSFSPNDGVYWVGGLKKDEYLVLTAQYYAIDEKTNAKKLHNFQVFYSCTDGVIIEDMVLKWVIH